MSTFTKFATVLACLTSTAGSIALATPAPLKLSGVGTGPNLAVGTDGRWHAIYFHEGTYRYRVGKPGEVAQAPELDTGLAVDRDAVGRGYGQILVDAEGTAHVFTGIAYRQVRRDGKPTAPATYGKRDPALALGPDGRVLLVMRGDVPPQPYTTDGLVHGAWVEPGDEKPGEIFKIDAGLRGRGNHIYPSAAATRDGTFHLVYRQGPENRVWYLSGRVGEAWRGGPVPVTTGEGPQLAVSSGGRLIVAGADGATCELHEGKWVERGNPVGGVNRRPPALAADKQGNVYIANEDRVAMLARGTDTWSRPVTMTGVTSPPAPVHGQGARPSARLASGIEDGAVFVYEGADGIHAVALASRAFVTP